MTPLTIASSRTSRRASRSRSLDCARASRSNSRPSTAASTSSRRHSSERWRRRRRIASRTLGGIGIRASRPGDVLQPALGREQLRDLADEERVAVGLAVDRRDQVGRSVETVLGLHEAGHVGLGQSVQRERRCVRGAGARPSQALRVSR